MVCFKSRPLYPQEEKPGNTLNRYGPKQKSVFMLWRRENPLQMSGIERRFLRSLVTVPSELYHPPRYFCNIRAIAKATISFIMSVCLSVCPSFFSIRLSEWNNSAALDGFSFLYLFIFRKYVKKNSSFIQIRQE